MATSAELEILLTEIDEAIRALILGKVKSYTIGDTTFRRHSLGELKEIRTLYRKELEGKPVEEITVFDDPDL